MFGESKFYKVPVILIYCVLLVSTEGNQTTESLTDGVWIPRELLDHLCSRAGNGEQTNQTNNYEFRIAALENQLIDINSTIMTLQAKIDSLQESGEAETQCQESWIKFKNHCYSVKNVAKNWRSAADHCRIEGGHLAIIETEEENLFVEGLGRENVASFWLDGTDAAEEGNWIWSSTATPFTFTAWRSRDPDGGRGQNCLVLHAGYGFKWIDSACSNDYSFVCEKE